MSRGAKAMVLTMWTLIPSDNQAGAAKATAAPCSLARSDTTLPMGGSRGAEPPWVNSFIPLKITITLHSKLLHSLQKPP